MKHWIFILPLLLAASANADNHDEGRKAVADCYSACLVRYEKVSNLLLARADRIVDQWLSDEVNALVDEQYAVVMSDERLRLCLQWQAGFREIDGCAIGCLDTEIAYDTKAAHTRSRFLQALRAEKDAITTAGLWKSYSYNWEPGEFQQACEDYFASLEEPAEAPAKAPRVTLEKPKSKDDDR